MRKWVIVVSTLLLLVAVNAGIASRERLLGQGRVVLLELAPVDPRAMMQGDYMALRFRVVDAGLRRAPDGAIYDGTLVVGLDARGVGTFRRIDAGTPLAADEARLKYRVRNGTPKLGTNAFFFEEGTGDTYAEARFGEFRVADDGEAILTGLRNAQLAPLGK